MISCTLYVPEASPSTQAVPSGPVASSTENELGPLIAKTAPLSRICVARSSLVMRIAPGRLGVGVGVDVGVGVCVAALALGVALAVAGTGVLVDVGVSVGGTGVLVDVGVSVGGTGVSVAVGVVVDVLVGGAQLPAIVHIVPSTFVNVAVRLDPAGPMTPMLLAPVSENGASSGPPGLTL